MVNAKHLWAACFDLQLGELCLLLTDIGEQALDLLRDLSRLLFGLCQLLTARILANACLQGFHVHSEREGVALL